MFGDAVGASPTLTWSELNALGIDDGPATFDVAVQVSDMDGGLTQSAPTTLTVTNTPPQSIQISIDQPAGPLFEGTEIVLSGSFVDPGIGETHTYLWEVTSSNGQLIADEAGTVLVPGQAPPLSFTPVNDGVYTVRLSIDDGLQTATGLVALGVGNVLPQNLNLSSTVNQVQAGQPVTVTGSFNDPGDDDWQATLVARVSATQEILFRLPLQLTGQAFATSVLFGQYELYELLLEVRDGADVVTSQPIFLLVGATLPGDYNGNGTVDTADYVLWRSDPSSYGGAQGYTDWVNNFGQTAGSGSGNIAIAAVPEPTSGSVVLVGDDLESTAAAPAATGPSTEESSAGTAISDLSTGSLPTELVFSPVPTATPLTGTTTQPELALRTIAGRQLAETHARWLAFEGQDLGDPHRSNWQRRVERHRTTFSFLSQQSQQYEQLLAMAAVERRGHRNERQKWSLSRIEEEQSATDMAFESLTGEEEDRLCRPAMGDLL